MSTFQWRPYVSVAKRRERAAKAMSKLSKKGQKIEGVRPVGRKIAETFWGIAWCSHLEKFSDYANRLPRGRSYLRNGSVCHLEVAKGSILAKVSGSSLYTVKIGIKPLPGDRWSELKARCTRGIGSLIELLQGKLSAGVMEVVTDRDRGLFPGPAEIDLDCSCPDWADMCKHAAAVMYGVGTRLDTQPELLFQLRGVDPAELAAEEAVSQVTSAKTGRRLERAAVADVFGIELAGSDASPAQAPSKRKVAPRAIDPATPVSGKDVAVLRRSFDMTQSQFARLLGMTAPAVALWEKRKGAIRMRDRSRIAWRAVAGLDRAEARHRLGLDR